MERHRTRHPITTTELLDVVGIDDEESEYRPDDSELLMRLQEASRVDVNERSDSMSSPSGVPSRPVIKRDRSSIGLSQKCSVCEVMTNGFHFGAVSCAACSAFFRRTVAENRTYVCRKEGDLHLKCPINQSARCYCRACRLQKCLHAGMDPSAVQPHRDVIGSKKRKMSRDQELDRRVDRNDGETLADHLHMQREYTRAIKSHSGYVTHRSDKISPTAHLLTSQNVLAEQLLAFSRTPVIASSSSIHTHSNSLPPIDNHLPMRESHSSNSLLGVKTVQEHANSLVEERRMGTTKREMEEMVVFEYDDEGVHEEEVECERTDQSIVESDSGSAMQYENFGDTPDPSCPNSIEVLVEAYGRLRERRRLIYCPPTIRDILGGTRPVSSESKEQSFYHRIKDKMRVEIALVAELLMSVPSFTSVPLDDQVLLFKNVSCYYNVMEKHYFTMLHDGVKLNRIVHNDLSYTDLNCASFPALRSESDEVMSDEMLIKLFIDPLKNSLHVLAGAMDKMRMSDAEFCGLVSVLLFDPTIVGLSEEGRDIVKESRDRAYKDWFTYYRMRGQSRDDAAQRVGETLLLIPAIQSTADLSRENFHLIRVFEIFEYDDLLDDVFNVRSSPSPVRLQTTTESGLKKSKEEEEKTTEKKKEDE